ncbi:hypothetical protein OJ998_04450 [Solirubrobacter taibaiensis]|nr:hypothetical protein [Solirubrobacter taibaiensis]
MKKFIIAALAALTAILAVPSLASASNCGEWYTSNRYGEEASVHSVVPMQGMNCASARYVVNKWLKRGYQRQSSNRIPTHFFDGYVTWNCRRTSGYGWRCDEYTSNTAFKFKAVYYG